ncbi:MAG: hypothetical protein ABEI27_14315 [Halobellus sp.]|uniref:hypothetical protein n=1 Tax=Halobellus sp. TaxID=1979212 RepID=UPI0035D44030
MIIGGFYLVAYLFLSIPALKTLPDGVRDPPARFPWHWTLDFLVTGLAGGVLLFLGFRRATDLTMAPGGDGSEKKRGQST